MDDDTEVDEVPSRRAVRRRQRPRGAVSTPGLNMGDAVVDTGNVSLQTFMRFLLIVGFLYTESAAPFIRMIQPEEMWLYRNPIAETPSLKLFGGAFLHFIFTPMVMMLYPLFTIAGVYWRSGSPTEARQAVCAYVLSVPLTGMLINIIKILVGRPRPDFLARCYQSYYLSYYDMSRACTGTPEEVMDGRKSFPSGHTGLAACVFGFLAWYLAAQIGTFHENSRHRSTSVSCILPLIMAPVVVGISRTCDYKHHWQDVLVGGMIGFIISYMCYRIYFPSITHERSDLSYFGLRKLEPPIQASLPQVSTSTSMQQVYRGTQSLYTTSEEERDGVVQSVRYRLSEAPSRPPPPM